MKIVSLDEVRNKTFCPSVTQEVVEMPPDPKQDIGYSLSMTGKEVLALIRKMERNADRLFR